MNGLERDFFSDPELIRDPGPYYAALREIGPVVREPHHGVFLVSGIEEILAVYADLDAFSSVVAPLGPFVPLSSAAQQAPHAEPPRGERGVHVDPRRRADRRVRCR